MKANYILYHPGTGGNFLTRIVTLDPNTVALGQGPYHHLTVDQRLEQYSYIGYPTLPIKPGDRNTWWQWELKNSLPLTRLGVEQCIDLDIDIVESHHPCNLSQHLELFSTADQIKFAYMLTDDAENWAIKQMRQKAGFAGKTDNDLFKVIKESNTDFINQFGSRTHYHTVYIRNIINDEQSFVDEYTKLCKWFELTAYPEHAIALRRQWIKTWG